MTLKDYWEAGRSFVDNQYDDLPLPDFSGADARWTGLERHKYHPRDIDTVNGPTIESQHRHPAVIEKIWTADDLCDYLNTASGEQRFAQMHCRPSLQNFSRKRFILIENAMTIKTLAGC